MTQDTFNLVSAIGIGLAFITGIINLTLILQQQKLENITKNRMEWINCIRLLISELIALANIENLKEAFEDNEIFHIKLSNLEQKVTLIRLYLNFKSEYDKEIIIGAMNIEDSIKCIFHYLELRRLESQQDYTSTINAFKDSIRNNNCNHFLSLLRDFSIKNNPTTVVDGLYAHGSLTRSEIRNVIINEYCVDRKDECYLHSFLKDDRFINDLINEIEDSKRELLMLVQIYLKSEWTRVKYESKTFKLVKYNEKKELEKLKWQYITTREF